MDIKHITSDSLRRQMRRKISPAARAKMAAAAKAQWAVHRSGKKA
jgi:hypothetical protein